MLKDYLFLFDIDGTLLDTKGYGKKAFIKSFEILFKKKINHNVSFLGGIDNVIFKELYNFFSLDINLFDQKWNDFKTLYLNKLYDFSKKKDWVIFPNVLETIKFLFSNSNIALATGNIKEGAFIKLKKFSLENFFVSGGYGDFAKKRADFINDAINEAEANFNKKFNKKNIFLFGDTEKDVLSAKETGINSVLIDYSGVYYEDAKKWEADYYGNFIYIDNLIKKILLGKKNRETTYLNYL